MFLFSFHFKKVEKHIHFIAKRNAPYGATIAPCFWYFLKYRQFDMIFSIWTSFPKIIFNPQ